MIYRITPTVVSLAALSQNVVPLSNNVVATATINISVSGTLRTDNNLQGSATLNITASGELTRGRVLSGAAVAGVVASGTIQSPIGLSGAATVGITASGTVEVLSTISAVAMLSVTASGLLSTPNTLTGAAIIPITLTGTMATEQEIADVVAGGITAWVVNLENGGHSSYTNYNFNSFFRVGNDYYGCNDSGIYKINGDNDAGTPVEWEVTTPVTTFGVRNIKYIEDARVIMRANSDVTITEIVDEQRCVTDLTCSDDGRNGLHARRIKLPRGLKGTSWQFTLAGTGAADIKTLEVEPDVSRRTR